MKNFTDELNRMNFCFDSIWKKLNRMKNFANELNRIKSKKVNRINTGRQYFQMWAQ